jgi:predicted nucleic acid-binding protein
MIYLDSSALVKRYVEEDGSDKVQLLISETDIVFVCRLAYPETLSAITRRQRIGDISDRSFKRVKEQFKSDWEGMTIVEIRNETLQFVDVIIDRYALKGADSVHLSSALWLKRIMKSDIAFVASDVALLVAAQKEKLKTVNPEHD